MKPTDQTPDSTQYHLNFTAHEYHNGSTSFNRTSQNAILNEAYQLLRDVIPVNPKRSSGITAAKTFKCNSRRSFTLSLCAPAVECTSDGGMRLKDWGEPVTADEMFELYELEEFVGTDWTYLLKGHEKLNASTSELKGEIVEPADRTIYKVQTNAIVLNRLIPQPHIYPSPVLSSEPPFDDRKSLTPQPCFVSPYSGLSLSDDNSRVAWLIPIRGVLPWQNCSSGIFLEDGSSNISAADPKTQICWTSESLLKFWNFLVELRTANTVGALGLSFHPARKNQRAKPRPANPRVPRLSTPVPTSNSNPSSTKVQPTLVMVDYIKVYHDVRRRIHMRCLLDEWSCSSSQGDQPRQYPILKHARLALLDDVSQAILVL